MLLLGVIQPMKFLIKKEHNCTTSKHKHVQKIAEYYQPQVTGYQLSEMTEEVLMYFYNANIKYNHD